MWLSREMTANTKDQLTYRWLVRLCNVSNSFGSFRFSLTRESTQRSLLSSFATGSLEKNDHFIRHSWSSNRHAKVNQVTSLCLMRAHIPESFLVHNALNELLWSSFSRRDKNEKDRCNRLDDHLFFKKLFIIFPLKNPLPAIIKQVMIQLNVWAWSGIRLDTKWSLVRTFFDLLWEWLNGILWRAMHCSFRTWTESSYHCLWSNFFEITRARDSIRTSQHRFIETMSRQRRRI